MKIKLLVVIVAVQFAFTVQSGVDAQKQVQDIVIEEYSKTDSLEEAKKVYVEAFFARTDFTFTKEQLSKNFENKAARFQEQYPNIRAFKAKKNGELIGFVVAALFTIESGAKGGFLLSLAVIPSEQSKGVGKKLLDALVVNCNLNEVEGYIKKGNIPAEKLFDHYGFKPLDYVPSCRGGHLNEPDFNGYRWIKN